MYRYDGYDPNPIHYRFCLRSSSALRARISSACSRRSCRSPLAFAYFCFSDCRSLSASFRSESASLTFKMNPSYQHIYLYTSARNISKNVNGDVRLQVVRVHCKLHSTFRSHCRLMAFICSSSSSSLSCSIRLSRATSFCCDTTRSFNSTIYRRNTFHNLLITKTLIW